MVADSDVLIRPDLSGVENASGDTLESCGISEGSTVYFSLSTFPEDIQDQDQDMFFMDDVEPSVQQTAKGLSVFLSSLYIIVSRVYFIDSVMNPFVH